MDNRASDVEIGIITVLSISRFEEDHRSLERIFRDFEGTLYPNCRPRLVRCSDPASALSVLHTARIPIVVCDADADPAGWEQIAREFPRLSEPPCLILSCSPASDCLSGTPAHGVYSALAKPFSGSEVLRIINLAWRHWQDHYGVSAAPPAVQAVQTVTGLLSTQDETENPAMAVRGTLDSPEEQSSEN